MSSLDKESDIIIPPGYKPLNLHEVPGENDPLRARVRWLQHSIPFLFNPDDPDYKALLEKCNEDTRALSNALQRVLDERNIPAYVKRSRAPAAKADLRKMSFFIRPPGLSSNISDEEKAKTRHQFSPDRDVFVLHFDQAHTLQMVRWWAHRDSGTGMRALFDLRSKIAGEIEKNRQFFKENYGKWDIIADKLASIIEPALRQYLVNREVDVAF